MQAKREKKGGHSGDRHGQPPASQQRLCKKNARNKNIKRIKDAGTSKGPLEKYLGSKPGSCAGQIKSMTTVPGEKKVVWGEEEKGEGKKRETAHQFPSRGGRRLRTWGKKGVRESEQN